MTSTVAQLSLSRGGSQLISELDSHAIDTLCILYLKAEKALIHPNLEHMKKTKDPTYKGMAEPTKQLRRILQPE